MAFVFKNFLILITCLQLWSFILSVCQVHTGLSFQPSVCHQPLLGGHVLGKKAAWSFWLHSVSEDTLLPLLASHKLFPSSYLLQQMSPCFISLWNSTYPEWSVIGCLSNLSSSLLQIMGLSYTQSSPYRLFPKYLAKTPNKNTILKEVYFSF